MKCFDCPHTGKTWPEDKTAPIYCGLDHLTKNIINSECSKEAVIARRKAEKEIFGEFARQ
jgi:hypothetical protein